MRFWEIDFARGIAVILMLIFHLFFDAYYFGKIKLEGDFWFWFPRFIGGMFIFISGFTFSIVYKNFKPVLRRTLRLLLIALGITLATFIFAPDKMVIFGIIHFFALSSFLGFAFIRKPFLSLSVGILFLIANFKVSELLIKEPYLVWLGIMPYGFRTLDYYPMIPWFGVFLLGMFFGSYYRRESSNYWSNPISFLGRHSLAIYLLQHPVIVLLLQLYYGDILNELFYLFSRSAFS
ncbi:MAG: heparan-alpha-glucosaminide N-acetyltransferase [Archaeoglobales archaeon]|nr:heparan-alpha-glucosaminide N-acetyltransferase [Archaeoglobales archaeon]